MEMNQTININTPSIKQGKAFTMVQKQGREGRIKEYRRRKLEGQEKS
jgi:hypothetical protein